MPYSPPSDRLLRQSARLRATSSSLKASSRRLRTELREACQSSRTLADRTDSEPDPDEIEQAIESIVEALTERGFLVIVLDSDAGSPIVYGSQSKLIQ
jgi:hypothetical protein